MTGFLSLLRAFLWLRWRTLVNQLQGSRRRGMEAQLSAWAEVAVWAVLGVFGAFGSVALAVGAGFVPPALVAGEELRLGLLVGVRVLLALVTGALLFFAVFQAYRGGIAGSPRLRLLPVSLRRLHLLELGSAAVDPWILLVLPALLVLTLAMLVVRPAGGLVVLLATILLLAVWVVLAATVGLAAQLLLRDRRRAGWVTLGAFVAWMALVSLPAVMEEDREEETATEAPAEGEAREVAGPVSGEEAGADGEGAAGGAAPAEGTEEDGGESDEEGGEGDDGRSVRSGFFPWFLQALPSEAYSLVLAGASAPRGGEVVEVEERVGEGNRPVEEPGRSGTLGALLRAGASSSPTAGGTVLGLSALALQLAVLYVLSLALWRRLLSHPAGSSGRRGETAAPLPTLSLPGLDTAAAAVAWAQVRGVWRTVQGKLTLAGPAAAVLIATFAFDLRQVEGILGEALAADAGAATAAAALIALVALGVTLLSQQAVQLNQFAVDETGFTLQLLSPLGDRTLLLGKALAGVVLTLASLLPALLVGAFLTTGASPWIWPAALGAALGVQGLLTPVSAGLSLFLPKPVDLDSLGQKGKAHQGAVFLGMLSVGLLLAPAVGVAALALLAWESPPLLFLAEAVVAVLCWLLAISLLRALEAPLSRRRESLFLTLAEGD